MATEQPNIGLNEQQFEQLFKEYFVPLSSFSNQYVGDLDAAKDITQKVFVTLWEKRQQMDPAGSLKSYLFTSVKNRSLNYIRDHKKYRSEFLDLECADLNWEAPEQSFDANFIQKRIDQALSELPEKCRQVFELSRFKGMKYREIAIELNIAQKTVEAHMSKAMKSLRERLKDLMIWVALMISTMMN